MPGRTRAIQLPAGAPLGPLAIGLAPALASALAYALASALALGATDACAQEKYPVRPVRIIVPAPPGAQPDLVARPVAEKLSEAFRQPFVVENRPGAGGALGVQSTIRAAPDGHTVLVGELGQITRLDVQAAHIVYDAARDLVAVAKLAEVPHALFAHPSLPVTHVRELVALARAWPGRITYATAGPGSFTDAVTVALNRSADIRLEQVQAAAGARPVEALLAGEALVGFERLQPRLADLRHKRLRALAVGTSHRVDAAPAVPTFAEAGLGEFRASPWLGLFAPAATPQSVVGTLATAAAGAIERSEVRRLFEQAGLQPARTPREKFVHHVRDDVARFEQAAREARGR